MADRANIFFNSFEAAAGITERKAKQLRREIEKIIREQYETEAPFVLNATISNNISRKTTTLINMFKKSYVSMAMKARGISTAKFATLTKAERSRLLSKMTPTIAMIKVGGSQLKAAVKAMLIQNVSGKIEFGQMVKGLQNLYPAYESHIYTEVNTSLQKSFKTTNFEKALDAGFEYFRYDGPDDSKTRPFCKEHVGRIFTKAQAEDIQAEMMTFYNCRHQLNPVTKAQYGAEK